MDFSKPIGSSKNSIDISTDNITTAVRLPDNIPRLEGGTLFISDGVMHMLPGAHVLNNSVDANGNILNTTTYRVNLTNRVWDFHLESQKWGVHVSEIEDQPGWAAATFDTRNQVGWYYGGHIFAAQYYNGTVLMNSTSNGPDRVLRDLYRLDRGQHTPIKVEADSSIVGVMNGGELVYIEGAGEAGILVLIGGATGVYVKDLGMVSMVDQIIKPYTSIIFCTNTLLHWQRSIQTVHIFDIATNTWFAQSTTAHAEFYPTMRLEFCSVVASASDNSSHNIYIYGGWDPGSESIKEDVYILTLPAFHWVLVYPLAKDASEINIRLTYKHKCQKIHEKHMISYRGRQGTDSCDYDVILKKFQGMAIYDMSSLTWTTKVELENPKYLVPEVLYGIIGGK